MHEYPDRNKITTNRMKGSVENSQIKSVNVDLTTFVDFLRFTDGDGGLPQNSKRARPPAKAPSPEVNTKNNHSSPMKTAPSEEGVKDRIGSPARPI